MQRTALCLLLLSLSLLNTSFAYNRESAIGVSVLSLLAWNPMKLDGIGIDYGEDESFKRSRMLWLWRFDDPIKTIGPINLEGHLELAFGQTQPNPQNVSIGLTPILEWTLTIGDFSPFIETGLGVNYLTRTEQLGRELSSHLQFGETLGIGASYKNVQVSARYQHISNADIVKPNNGYNFYGLMLKFWY
jgi:hypothetical protein